MLDITYGQVIEEADNYSQIPFDTLDKSTTYIFELVSPKTKVVVPYPKTSLYHLGTRSNITGLESETDIAIKKPQSYPITSLQDCIQASLALNDGASDNVEKEGFVVVDKDYHRVKIKSPDYLVLSRLTQLKMVSKSDAVELILNGKEKIEPICKANPDLIPYFKYYEFRVSELITLAGKMALLARGLYKEFDMNKGAVPRVISSHRLSWFGFSALGNDRTGEELVRALPIEKLVKFFPEYELEDLRALFLNKTDK